MIIGVYDSGIGGLPYLKELMNLFPNNNYIYLADQKDFPYGEKKDNELENIILRNIYFFEKKKIDILFIACNTASICYYKLKNKFLFKIITIPKLIIKSIYNSNNLRGIFIGTKNTIESGFYQKELSNNIINYVIAGNLIKLIEEQVDEEVLNFEINKLNLDKYDFIILGCTHFLWIKDIIIKRYPNLKIYDGIENLKNILIFNNLNKKSSCEIICNYRNNNMKKVIKKLRIKNCKFITVLD